MFLSRDEMAFFEGFLKLEVFVGCDWIFFLFLLFWLYFFFRFVMLRVVVVDV